VSVVQETEEAPATVQSEEDIVEQRESLAQDFFDGVHRFSTGRVLMASADGEALRFEGQCAPDGTMQPDQNLLARFAADLAGWDNDTETELNHPQLIVMRPSGGKGAGLAVVHDGEQIAVAVHEARKLGAVVNLWSSLLETGK
jgi:hypothetical protein